MKAITLSSPQQTQAKANLKAMQDAQAALQAAANAHAAYLRTAASLPATARVQLSDDGTMVICS